MRHGVLSCLFCCARARVFVCAAAAAALITRICASKAPNNTTTSTNAPQTHTTKHTRAHTHTPPTQQRNSQGTDDDALDYALNRAVDAFYNDRAWFRSLQARVMRQDWSWNRPAIDYVELYYAAVKAQQG